MINLLSYIGYGLRSKIEILNADTWFDPGWDVGVFYLPTDAQRTQGYRELLAGIVQCPRIPPVMRARAALVISRDYPGSWERFFARGNCPEFEVDDEFLDAVAWNEPSPTLLHVSHFLAQSEKRAKVEEFRKYQGMTTFHHI
jgi:hypothetical protein